MEGKRGRAFLFYASNLDVLQKFPPDRARKLAMKIVEYGFKDESFSCSEEDKFFLNHIFIGIDGEQARYNIVKTLDRLIRTMPNYGHDLPKEEFNRKLQELKKLQVLAHRQEITIQDIFDVLGTKLVNEIPSPFTYLLLLLNHIREPIRRSSNSENAENAQRVISSIDTLISFCHYGFALRPSVRPIDYSNRVNR